MRIARVIAIGVGVLTLAGCTAVAREVRRFPENFNPPVNVVEYNYAAADALVGQARERVTLNDSISIGILQPMNLKPEEKTPPLGQVIADHIGNRLVQLGYKVQESGGNAVINGSYTIAPYDILVNLRMVEVSSGRVVAATDYRLPLGSETYELLNRDVFFGKPITPPKNETDGAPPMPAGDLSALPIAPVRIIPLPDDKKQ